MTKPSAHTCASSTLETNFVPRTLLQSDNGQAVNYSYDNVQNWSRHVPGKSLFLLVKIIFPINVNGNHWVCVMVSIPDRKIQYHDSLGGKGRIFLESILRYLKDEHLHHNCTALPGDWSQSLIAGPKINTHKQTNSFECGVFVCAIADCLMRGQSLDFTQH
jgi:sentrin-specific protease 1